MKDFFKRDDICLMMFYVVDKLREKGTRLAGERKRHFIETLSYRQAKTLFIVAGYLSDNSQGIRLKELSRRLDITIPATSILVESLVQKKVLLRQSCPTDRRAVSICLAPFGEQTLETLARNTNEQIQKLLKGLTPEQIAVFETVVRHFYSALDETA